MTYQEFVLSGVCRFRSLSYQKFVISGVCLIGSLSFQEFVFSLLFQEFVLSEVCYFRTLSYQEFVISGVCLIRSLSYQKFVISGVCLIRSLLFQDFVLLGSFKNIIFSYLSYLSIIFYYTPPSWKLEYLCLVFLDKTYFVPKYIVQHNTCILVKINVIEIHNL